MDTRLRISGHPIQPVLVTFPVGLFVCAVVFDVGRLVGAPAIVGEVGYWTASAGLVATALTTVAGMIDLWDVPPGPTRRAVVTFNLVNAAAAAIFLIVCVMRATTPDRLASGGMVVVEILALVLGGLGIRLGTVLIRRFGTMAADVADAVTRPAGRIYGTPRQPAAPPEAAGAAFAAGEAADVETTIELRAGLAGLGGMAADTRHSPA